MADLSRVTEESIREWANLERQIPGWPKRALKAQGRNSHFIDREPAIRIPELAQ